MDEYMVHVTFIFWNLIWGSNTVLP